VDFFIILIEGVLISFLVFRLYKLSRSYNRLGKEGTFLEKIELVLKQSFPKPAAVIITREITMICYLFARKSVSTAGDVFTYHKGVGYKGVLIALLSVILLESAGLFFLLHKWSPILSWVHLALNVYGLLYLISDYRAIIQLPIIITDHALQIRVGSRRQLTVPLEKIASINGASRFIEEKKNKDVFKAVLIEIDTPQFELNLKEPITTTNFLGKPQQITKVYLTVDDKEKFLQLLQKKVAI
jgi:hypothetical protein